MTDASNAAVQGEAGDLSPSDYTRAIWNESLIAGAGIPIEHKPFVTIGGGLGSFALVDTLRIAGVPIDEMVVLTDIDRPTETYELLARNSQIPRDARLRSDSGSVMDNIWGWPGYALREAWAKKSVGPAWQVAAEPVFSEYFTPEAGQVFESVDREAERIGWSAMVRKGRVRTIRRAEGGGYFVLHSPDAPVGSRRKAYKCENVHLAIGYPGIALLPDLQAYRQKYNDHVRVVNSYEPHDHVYDELRNRPSTVLVRGSGIVASRVLQRLMSDREERGAETTIVHLFRNYVAGPQGTNARFRRPGENGFAYQAFNFPKAAWGGQLRDKLASLEGDARAEFLDRMGGTNTAYRQEWQAQLERGIEQRYYTQAIGKVTAVEPTDDGASIRTSIMSPTGVSQDLDAQFIIDATGLAAGVRSHRVLADLLDYGEAQLNPKGRLDVDRKFEVRGTRHGTGTIYASGSITLGGYYAGVDSFLGLQYVAIQIADDLARRGFGKRIGPMRSTRQWLRWARNQQP